MSALKNRRGQVAVEYILLMVILMVLVRLVVNQVQQQEVLASFAAGPWAVIAGVIENGVPGTPAKTKEQHPGLVYRHITMKGERRGGSCPNPN